MVLRFKGIIHNSLFVIQFRMIEQKILKSKMLIWIAATILVVGIILLFALLSRSFVRVKIEPANARVEVNNMVIPLDNSGYARATVKPGSTRLKVSAEGYIGYDAHLELKRGKTSSYNISLRKTPTPVNIGNADEADNTVQFISPADENNSMFYLGNAGKTMYKATFSIDNNYNISTLLNKPITNPILSGITDVIWSPKKDVAIFKKAGGVYTIFDFKKYNFLTQVEEPFGENIGDLAWSPDNSRIAYYYAPPSGEKSLIFANKSNTEQIRVANLAEEGINNPHLSWSPDSRYLIVVPRNEDKSTNKIYLFDITTRSFKVVNDAGNNVEAIYNKKGTKIIYSTYSPDPSTAVKQTLSIMDADGNNKRALDLRAFIPKILFKNLTDSSLIAATLDPETGRESIFMFNMESKYYSGFKLNLPEKTYVKEMTLSLDDRILFYIANDKFYALASN